MTTANIEFHDRVLSAMRYEFGGHLERPGNGRDDKVRVLKAIPTLSADNVVRGQFRGYRLEKGVARDSKVETFVALRLQIDSWRWQGVPFYIRAGKCLTVTCTEVVVRLRRPPTMDLQPNHCRLR
jgi:glucose-6-phosphate 1-dehydrogenase